MKKNVTRIYDKRKASTRKKYLLAIVAIIMLQIALYIGVFSKAESVISIKYINYYTLEESENSIAVESDLTGKYIILPENINNREVLNYYIGEGEESNTYKPNDVYRISDEESLTVKVEYGETVVSAYNDAVDTNEQTSENEATVNEAETNSEETVDIYLGECGQEGEEGTELNPYRFIETAFAALPDSGGKIIIKGYVEVENWASLEAASNKDVIIEGYNNDSQIIMEGDWKLQGNTTIRNVKIIMSETKQNLAIHANGYNLTLGAEGLPESLKISAKSQEYYPTVYGGSTTTIHSGIYQNIYGGSKSQKITGDVDLKINYAVCYESIYGGSNTAEIVGNVNLNIEYANVKGNIYGGSNSGKITGNTDLNITNAEVGLSVYGGSYSAQLNGTSTTVIQYGKYGTLLTDENEIAISGGNNGGARQTVLLTINNATVINGCIAGAGASTDIQHPINMTIEKIKLGEDGQGTSSIYGYSYSDGTVVASDITMNIKEIEGRPKYIIGYCNTESATAMSGSITMDLSNINSTVTEIYGGSYNGTQTQAIPITITTNNVNAKLLSAGGLKDNSIKSYEITVNGGSFTNGIYAGVGTNETVNVIDDENNITLNSYKGKLIFKNKGATITLNNSNVTTYDISSFRDVNIDKDSELSINDTKQVTFYGNLAGEGTLRLEDNTTVSFVNKGITGPLEIDIIEDSDNTSSFVNIISGENETKEELYLNEELEGYTTEFIEDISFWKFYIGDNAIQSVSDCVYINSIYGDDSNSGEITAPVKTIARASEIIKGNPIKKKVVTTSNLDLNIETRKEIDTSDIYTVITTTDGIINFQKYVDLAKTTNNIYQNIEFADIDIISSSGTKNIYLNGNKLKINNSVKTSGTISLYGGSSSRSITGDTNIDIYGGTWSYIYGGSSSGNITGNTFVNIYDGTFNGNIYGGSTTGSITGNTTVKISGGNIQGSVYGGSNRGSITGDTHINISGGTLISNIYGGSSRGSIEGNTHINISGGNIQRNIYGGSYDEKIVGNTNIDISAGNLAGVIYAGSYSGEITGDITSNIIGGTNLKIGDVKISRKCIWWKSY